MSGFILQCWFEMFQNFLFPHEVVGVLHFTGLYGVSADLLGLPDPEFVIGWDLAPTPLGPGTKGVVHVHLGALEDHLQGCMGFQ